MSALYLWSGGSNFLYDNMHRIWCNFKKDNLQVIWNKRYPFKKVKFKNKKGDQTDHL